MESRVLHSAGSDEWGRGGWGRDYFRECPVRGTFAASLNAQQSLEAGPQFFQHGRRMRIPEQLARLLELDLLGGKQATPIGRLGGLAGPLNLFPQLGLCGHQVVDVT